MGLPGAKERLPPTLKEPNGVEGMTGTKPLCCEIKAIAIIPINAPKEPFLMIF
jgi:hypothetical protein